MTLDIHTKLNSGAYTTNLEYPRKPVQPEILKRSAAMLTRADILTIPDIKDQYDADLAAYRAAQTAYGEDQARLDAEFKSDLEAFHGTTGHPKADLLYSKAWDQGHSSGYSDVANVYDDLVDLIK